MTPWKKARVLIPRAGRGIARTLWNLKAIPVVWNCIWRLWKTSTTRQDYTRSEWWSKGSASAASTSSRKIPKIHRDTEKIGWSQWVNSASTSRIWSRIRINRGCKLGKKVLLQVVNSIWPSRRENRSAVSRWKGMPLEVTSTRKTWSGPVLLTRCSEGQSGPICITIHRMRVPTCWEVPKLIQNNILHPDASKCQWSAINSKLPWNRFYGMKRTITIMGVYMLISISDPCTPQARSPSNRTSTRRTKPTTALSSADCIRTRRTRTRWVWHLTLRSLVFRKILHQRSESLSKAWNYCRQRRTNTAAIEMINLRPWCLCEFTI